MPDQYDTAGPVFLYLARAGRPGFAIESAAVNIGEQSIVSGDYTERERHPGRGAERLFPVAGVAKCRRRLHPGDEGPDRPASGRGLQTERLSLLLRGRGEARLISGFGVPEFDSEGRYLEVRIGKLGVVSVYLPSGSSGDERQASKYRFLDAFVPHLRKLHRRRSEYILCGDWNIAHKEIDLRNWRANRKNSGFLPEERKWMDDLFGTHRYVDAFRVINQEAEQYTWWSNRGRAWDKNVGWRLDSQIVTPGLRDKVLRCEVYKTERFSDHAPLIMDYDVDV